MPIIIGRIRADGALVEVEIGWSHSVVLKQRRALRPVPPPVLAKAMIDSGAEITCVDSHIIQQLGLPYGGSTLANVPVQTGLTISSVHDISMVVLHPSGNAQSHLELRNHTVLELTLNTLGYQMLVGRDVLANCKFLFDGQRARFFLKFP